MKTITLEDVLPMSFIGLVVGFFLSIVLLYIGIAFNGSVSIERVGELFTIVPMVTALSFAVTEL